MAERQRAHRIGDGDVCPVDPLHEQMFTLMGSTPPKQYCPDQSHDGEWAEGAKSPPTPRIWPLHAFEAAVAEYHGSTAGESGSKLPDLSFLRLEV